MKLAVIVVMILCLYGIAMRYLVKEYISQPDKRKENQSIPIIVAATMFVVVVVYQLINLSTKGFISL